MRRLGWYLFNSLASGLTMDRCRELTAAELPGENVGVDTYMYFYNIYGRRVLGPFGSSGHETRPAKSTSEFGTPAVFFLNRDDRFGRRRFRNRSHRMGTLKRREKSSLDSEILFRPSISPQKRSYRLALHALADLIAYSTFEQHDL